MKIIELLEKRTNEGIGSAIGGIAKGADEFIKGASGGEVDIGGTIRKYTDPEWRDKNERGRGVGRNLPDDTVLRNVIRTEYKLENPNVNPQDIYDDYAKALKTGNEEEVAKVKNKYISSMVDQVKRDLKKPNRDALLRLLKKAR